MKDLVEILNIGSVDPLYESCQVQNMAVSYGTENGLLP